MLIRWGGGGSPTISLSDAYLLSISLRARRGMTAGGKLVAQSVGTATGSLRVATGRGIAQASGKVVWDNPPDACKVLEERRTEQ